MSGTACSAACGWCGACSSSWEGPQTVTVHCVQCTRRFETGKDDRPPYRCHYCLHNNAERAQRRFNRDVA